MENDGYEVRIIDDQKGKGLIALREFKEGDIILQEKPLLSCQYSWNADYGYLACDECMLPLESAEENVRRLTGKPDIVLPYPELCTTDKSTIVECQACGVKYCSSECLQEAYEKYHKTLCLQSRDDNKNHPLNVLRETWKHMYYPPETATIMLLARMVAYVNQATNKDAAIAAFSTFCNRTINEAEEITHNLLGETFAVHIDVLRQTMENALSSEFVPFWFTPEGFRGLLALVGTNGQGIGTSPLSRWFKHVSALNLETCERKNIDEYILKLYDDIDEVVGTFRNNEGSGLYLQQSTINHSCSPNAMVEFPYSNNTLVVTAIRNIIPGEEICIGYLDECELARSRHSRQKILSSFYLFVCVCEKCNSQVNDPDVTSADESTDESEEED